jgi:uncharacterized protein
MIEVTVQSLGLDRSSNTPVVILQERDGARVLPIWIGPGEASSIAMELAGMNFSRPLTHDLFASAITGLGGALKRVNITKVVENTYYAEMIITRTASSSAWTPGRPTPSPSRSAWTPPSSPRTTCWSTRPSRSPRRRTSRPATWRSWSSEAPEELSPEDLKEYLRRLHPEDFGRFTP